MPRHISLSINHRSPKVGTFLEEANRKLNIVGQQNSHGKGGPEPISINLMGFGGDYLKMLCFYFLAEEHCHLAPDFALLVGYSLLFGPSLQSFPPTQVGSIVFKPLDSHLCIQTYSYARDVSYCCLLRCMLALQICQLFHKAKQMSI